MSNLPMLAILKSEISILSLEKPLLYLMLSLLIDNFYE